MKLYFKKLELQRKVDMEFDMSSSAVKREKSIGLFLRLYRAESGKGNFSVLDGC